MKKLVTAAAILAVLSASNIFAQNAKFTEAMKAALSEMDRSFNAQPDVKAYQEVANKFERIASAEAGEWLPAYYAAYCYINMSYFVTGLTEKDQYLDKAAGYLSQAEKRVGKPSDEVAVLEANLLSARLAADAGNRWQEYGPKVSQSMEKAKKLNPDNPRIYVLEGSGLFYTPKEYGGGKEAARPVFEKALQKFDTFKPESELHPDWGRSLSEYFLAQ